MPVHLSELKPDANSGTPLYLQLANKLSDAIQDGALQPDESLPSERTLAEVLNISRATARKAIDILHEKGMLLRKRGSGNYIMPRLEQPLASLTNFSEELRQRGFRAGSRWLSRETGVATTQEVVALGLSPCDTVSRLKRLRTADNVVIAIESTTIPGKYLPDPSAVRDSLYGYLYARNLPPSRALQHIGAVNATAEQAQLANIAQGEAMLFITRVSYLENGNAIELTHSYCVGDYYEFVAELRG